MTKLINSDGNKPHPAAYEFCDQYRRGLIDRRTLLRMLGWLGVSTMSMRAVAGEPMQPPAPETPTPGGVLRFVCAVQQMTDPALTNWDRSLQHLPELDRVSDLCRPRQRHPPVSRVRLDRLRRSEDLGFHASGRRPLVERGPLHQRRCRLQHQSLDLAQVGILEPHDLCSDPRGREDRRSAFPAASR